MIFSFSRETIRAASLSLSLVGLNLPELPSINQAPQGIIDENTKVVLTCEIDGGSPLAVIVWDCSNFTPVLPTGEFTDKVVSSVQRVRITGIQFSCVVEDTNPAVTSFSWKKDNKEISKSSNYTIQTVQRSQTGSYTCDATNIVNTSDQSPVLQFYVLCKYNA
ncbi:unnamed protein product [Mytilus edulis]|uniref:Ig-like domain-containing protein n=1 Tax=Mytilus edulis TaxID=6550 RepID=A0A8S3TT09_MYTED|nr:unnamed protein product [Mytilus edulis]